MTYTIYKENTTNSIIHLNNVFFSFLKDVRRHSAVCCARPWINLSSLTYFELSLNALFAVVAMLDLHAIVVAHYLSEHVRQKVELYNQWNDTKYNIKINSNNKYKSKATKQQHKIKATTKKHKIRHWSHWHWHLDTKQNNQTDKDNNQRKQIYANAYVQHLWRHQFYTLTTYWFRADAVFALCSALCSRSERCCSRSLLR